jgi:hypothetical protein
VKNNLSLCSILLYLDLNDIRPRAPFSDTQGADKSLARPTSRYILFDGENISFDASLFIYGIYIYIYIYIYY